MQKSPIEFLELFNSKKCELYLQGMPFTRKEFHKEENCLNCDYPLVGKFCGNCGQKAFLHKDSFWHMVVHFVGDYFHYDNKFWITMKALFTKPGLATLEYIQGKRAKYLNPIQLYIFVTTLLVLVGFTSTDDDHSIENKHNSIEYIDNKGDSSVKFYDKRKSHAGFSNNEFSLGKYSPNETTLEAYDSVQNSLPTSKKDGFILHHLRKKSFKHHFGFSDLIVHNFLKLFFLLLPFFAFLLKIIFRKHHLFYVDHLIFSIHYHSVIFLFIIITALLGTIYNNEYFSIIITLLVIVGIAIYLFLCLKRVYPTNNFKLIIKQLILFILYFVGFIISLILYAFVLFIFF